MKLIKMQCLIKYIYKLDNVFFVLMVFFSKDFGIAIWLKNGAPAHKLVLGIPLFARTFRLARVDQNELRSPTIGNGTEGPFTRSAGFLSYFEVNLCHIEFIFIFFDI